MAKHLDKGKIENALKRAAQVAVSGSREDRSGKFIPRKVPTGQVVSDNHRGKAIPKG
jgi:hypothetical protein